LGNYTISPALPAWLTLDPATGVITTNAPTQVLDQTYTIGYDVVTPCAATVSKTTTVTIKVEPISAPPVIDNQAYCPGQTLADLKPKDEPIQGWVFKWYDAPTNGTLLPKTTAVTNTTYYVSITTQCGESTRTPVTTTAIAPITQLPVYTPDPYYCVGTPLSLDPLAQKRMVSSYTGKPNQ
jgi:hypothetical protein